MPSANSHSNGRMKGSDRYTRYSGSALQTPGMRALVQDRVALGNTSIMRPTPCFNPCEIVALDYPALTRQALLFTPHAPHPI